RGEVLTGGWKEEAVREALDLCLACKGCKSDCPVGVDVASWKAEFLSHYYRGRLRPAAAVRALAEIAPERKLPRVAAETFRRWFARRAPATPRAPGRGAVLFPDT